MEEDTGKFSARSNATGEGTVWSALLFGFSIKYPKFLTWGFFFPTGERLNLGVEGNRNTLNSIVPQ